MHKILQEKPGKTLGCTSVYDELAKLAKLPGSALGVLVTDGIETCSVRRRIESPRSGPVVLVILVASKADTGKGKSASREFEKRKSMLLADAPWLRAIVTPFEVNDLNIAELMKPVPADSEGFK